MYPLSCLLNDETNLDIYAVIVSLPVSCLCNLWNLITEDNWISPIGNLHSIVIQQSRGKLLLMCCSRAVLPPWVAPEACSLHSLLDHEGDSAVWCSCVCCGDDIKRFGTSVMISHFTYSQVKKSKRIHGNHPKTGFLIWWRRRGFSVTFILILMKWNHVSWSALNSSEQCISICDF